MPRNERVSETPTPWAVHCRGADRLAEWPTSWLVALEKLKCFNCGTQLTCGLSKDMCEIFLEKGRRYDAGEIEHDITANERAPFWRKGQYFMCQPLREMAELDPYPTCGAGPCLRGIRETATHYGLTTAEFRARYAAYILSEGWDESGHEHTLDSWMRRRLAPVVDPTPWQKGDDSPA